MNLYTYCKECNTSCIKQKYLVYHTRTQKHSQTEKKYKSDEDIYNIFLNYLIVNYYILFKLIIYINYYKYTDSICYEEVKYNFIE